MGTETRSKNVRFYHFLYNKFVLTIVQFYNRPGTVTFSLTAAVVSMEINLNEEGIQINSFQVIKPQ